MCSPDIPSPDPLIGEAAKNNVELGKEALAFYKDLYTNELIPMQKESAALNKTLIDKYLASMDKQAAFADKQNEYYESTFQPIEKQMAKDAMEYDSKANIDRRMGIAGANVEQQFSQAQAQNARNLSRYGLNPNSSAFGKTNERLMREGALQKAGAMTGAAFDTMDRGIALRAGAANFGRNMPNTAAGYYNNANAAGGGAMGAGQASMNSAINAAGMVGQGYGMAMQGNSSGANIAQGDYNSRMNAYQQEQGMWGNLLGIGLQGGMAWMTGGASLGLGGKKADGGHIRGPGGPVDDKIPALLSDGEYVIPADVVKAKGVEFFEKLKSKYHTPAARQRAIERN